MDDLNVWLDGEGILHIELGTIGNVSLEVVEEAHRQHRALSSESGPVLIQADQPLRLDHRAATFASEPQVCSLVSAMAIVVHSAWAVTLGKMFLFYHRPPYPSRLFTDRDEALRWLQGFVGSDPRAGDLP